VVGSGHHGVRTLRRIRLFQPCHDLPAEAGSRSTARPRGMGLRDGRRVERHASYSSGWKAALPERWCASPMPPGDPRPTTSSPALRFWPATWRT